ncbi:MAG TPA: LysM peptidoglycan-binding domain-containing protein [Candidatus Binatia bacterium]|nr:LysM peptidoglycan-binding domain-containing protein [Candidatus Binatia bacterium]
MSNRFGRHFRLLVWSLFFGGLLGSTLADQFTYIVKRGDTLSGIAQQYGVSVTALADRNGLSRNYLLKTGQRLVIFAATRESAANPRTDAAYVVKPGDTLFDIAQAHNLSVAELAGRNGLNPDYHVKAGEQLTISSGATTTSNDIAYVVKRGDTLFDLAKANRISVDELAERNGLDKDYQLKIGDRLILPGSPGTDFQTAAPDPSASLPSSIGSAIRNAPVAAGRWKYIVVHHSGVDEGTVKGMDRYHRDVRHMENGLAYHFVIGNGHGMGDGEIAVGNRWKKQLDGGHLRSLEQDKIALGICLVGNFDKSYPTAAQMKSLNALVRALMERCDIPADHVKTHQQINIIGTRCPGSHFPTKSFLAGLKD